jgi:hypothetical protein
MALAGLVGALGACYDGAGTVGSVCVAKDQCGLEQDCVNSICGLCENRLVDPGELCFGNSSEENVFGEVTELLAYDPEDDGFAPLLLAIVNTNCLPVPMTGPPPLDGMACWQALALTRDEADGDFEVTNLFDSGFNDGRIPQATIGDFDGQETRDLALAIVPSDPLVDQTQLVVAHNLALAGEPIIIELGLSLRAKSLFAADLNGDGLDDLLVGGEISNTLAVYISQPGPGFEGERLLVIEDAAPRPAPPIDMDNDGDLDVVLVSPVDRTISVYLNDGDGFLTNGFSESFASTHAPLELVAAHLDDDGNADVVAFLVPDNPNSGVESELHVFRGRGDGTLTADATPLPGGELPVSGLATDVNADGWPDIVIADALEDKLPVHINRNGEFPDIVGIDVAASPVELMHEDFNLDNVPDLVVGNANGVVAVVPTEN